MAATGIRYLDPNTTPMKIHSPSRFSRLILPAFLLLLTPGVAAPDAPKVTEDGLTQVAKSKADLVYVRSGVSFAGYKKLMLIEPTIAFRKNWQTDQKFQTPSNPVTDADMAKMIETGKQVLVEEFGEALTKAGYTFVAERGADVLAIKPQILELDIAVPDPDNSIGSYKKVYTDDAGEATMVIELYDSVTGQLLARAFDRTTADYNSFNRRTERTQQTNLQDAHYVTREWARMLVKGLERAKAAKTP
jgi:hypothetical protein